MREQHTEFGVGVGGAEVGDDDTLTTLVDLRDYFWALAAQTHGRADRHEHARGRRYGGIAVYLIEAIDELDHT